MTERSRYEIIKPPNLMAAKVPRSGGPKLNEIVAKAEVALDGLKDEFHGWIKADLEQLQVCLDEASKTPNVAREAVHDMFNLAHQIRGKSGTFDFPLLSKIAASLCAFIEADEARAARKIDLLSLHVDAMQVVINQEVRGDGGEIAQQVVASLMAAVEKAVGNGAKA